MSQTQHVAAAGPSRWKDNQELWWKEANRRSLPWRGQSFRYRLDRCPPLQTNTPKLPVLHSPHILRVPPGSVLYSLYVNDISTSHQVELALYADYTAVIATSRKPTLLVSYLESYLNDLQRWLNEWRIAINVSKSCAMIFASAGQRFIQPRPVTLFVEPIQWVETTRYQG